MKMNRLTKTGILLIVIGLSFLVSTLYRSTSESGNFGIGTMKGGLAPNTWSVDWNPSLPNASTAYTPSLHKYFLIPREHKMNIQTNTVIDVYVLDSEGAQLWLGEGKLEPIVSFEGVKQQVVTFNIPNRDDYSFLVHNPSAENAQYTLSVSGYGIETDLLYLSLIITVFGAVVTLVSFIPRGSGRRKQSLATKKAVLPAAVLVILILSLSTASCVAQFQASSMLAPSWMKEGTYVSYDFTPHSIGHHDGVLETSQSQTVFFLNGPPITYRNVTSVIFRWECTDLKEDIATLDVSYSITSDLASDNFYASTLVDVDIATRNVYFQNGTLIGTTILWLPSRPAEGQEVTLWDVPPDKATANVVTKGRNGENIYNGQASQGAQRAFMFKNVTGTINGQEVNISTFQGGGWYDYDTGLYVTAPLRHESVFTALGINNHGIPNSMTTNVDLGPAHILINWGYVLSLAAVVGSIVLVVAFLLIKRHRQRR
jgi:hypothetical protein